mmetsp:Transcript_814/g.2208  ORF Transcript_814/g.2208 Transcript_814/m.2208 type:complete len:219 (+) Transcript_814:977-1633(+)
MKPSSYLPKLELCGPTAVFPDDSGRSPLVGHHSQPRADDLVLQAVLICHGYQAHHGLGRVGDELYGHFLLHDYVIDGRLALENAPGRAEKGRHGAANGSIVVCMEPVVGCRHHVVAEELVDALEHRRLCPRAHEKKGHPRVLGDLSEVCVLLEARSRRQDCLCLFNFRDKLEARFRCHFRPDDVHNIRIYALYEDSQGVVAGTWRRQLSPLHFLEGQS